VSGRRKNLLEEADGVAAAEARGLIVPCAPECEAGVLSILAQFPKETTELLQEEQCGAEWFHHEGHRKFYELLASEIASGRAVTFTSLATRARDLAIAHELTLAAGEETWTAAAAISKLLSFEPSGARLGQYLDELREKFLARGVQAACRATLKAIEENWQTAGLPLVQTMHAELGELASYGVRLETVKQVRPYIIEALEKIQTQFKARAGTLGLSTGFEALDRCLNGLKKGHGYYIGGRPAMGKSAVMGDIMAFIGTNPDPWARAHALVFSIEMTGLQLMQRELMKEARVSQQRVRDGLLSEERDFPKLTAAAKKLAESRIYVDETSTLTLDDFSARVRRFVRKVRQNETPADRARREKGDRPDVVVAIDYLQRLKGSSKRAKDNRYLEIAEICQGISALIKELLIAAVVVVQLGRNEKEGADNFPALSDMRESGDIEAEAHVVVAMHRPAYYLTGEGKKEKWCDTHNKRLREQGGEAASFEWRVGTDKAAGVGQRDLTHLAYAVVLKQREGPVGELMLHFEPQLARFSNWNERERLLSNNPEERQTPNIGAGDAELGGEVE
jgi:replicative DNA helicase